MDYKENLRLIIERSIDNVCPYEDQDLQKMYHIGFMQSLLVELFLRDNANQQLFKKLIEEKKRGSKK